MVSIDFSWASSGCECLFIELEFGNQLFLKVNSSTNSEITDTSLAQGPPSRKLAGGKILPDVTTDALNQRDKIRQEGDTKQTNLCLQMH